ncbi:MAG: hypothetical protein ACJ8FD_19760, partial [Bradyrhizobium canariense]
RPQSRTWLLAKRASRPVRTEGIDVEIDNLDALLALAMARARVPFPPLKRDLRHLRQFKALPGPSGRQAFAGTAAKLKGERAFLAIGTAQY